MMSIKNLTLSCIQRNTCVFKSLLVVVSMLFSACSGIYLPEGESNTNLSNVADHQQLYRGGEYRIGPEDVLDISVWREETLQRKVKVRPDGGISFPLVGDLQAAGKTTDMLRSEITEKLKKYIPEPAVTVAVDQVEGYRIYVLGKVNKPGQYVVGRYVDVLQALTLAGGLTPFADENGIKIVRRDKDKEIVLPFVYSAVKRGQGLEQNILLKSDDVVVVP